MPIPDWQETRDALVETYRILNMEFRGKDEEALAATRNGTSAKDIIRGMRDDELLFAKNLNESLTGEAMGASTSEEDKPLIGNEVAEETSLVLISQFGSARATTLNTMQSSEEEDWSRPIVDNKTMLELAKELAEQDRANIEQLRSVSRT